MVPERDPATSLLADLVAIPSVNPMGRAGGSFGEEKIARYVEAYLCRLGVDVQTQEVAPGRLNVIGHIDAGRDTTVLLEAHLDTVHVDTMSISPFVPEIRNDRLFGRGSCDTKASLAAFLEGMAYALKAGRRQYNVVFAGIADEEYQFNGARAAVRSGLRADMGISGEPTNLAIVRAHKGVTRWMVATHGVAAHSAYPERGRNAIYMMGEVVGALQRHAEELANRPRHKTLGVPSLSVGVIHGGEAVNIVPDRCVIEVDRRTLPGETTESVIKEAADSLRPQKGWEFERPYLSVGGMEVYEGAKIVQELSLAAGSVTGKAPAIEAAHYATDAGTYNAAGIPTVVFGPGDIADAHTDAESVDLGQVREAALIIRRLITGP